MSVVFGLHFVSVCSGEGTQVSRSSAFSLRPPQALQAAARSGSSGSASLFRTRMIWVML